MAIVDLGGAREGGARKECSLAYVPDAKIGDYVIVQNGFAITTLEEKEALASLAAFADLGLLDGLGHLLNHGTDSFDIDSPRSRVDAPRSPWEA